MHRTPNLRRPAGLALAGFLVFAAPLAAQSVLVVEHGDQLLPVVHTSGMRPFVQSSGHLVAANGHKLALRSVEEYMPVLISVRDYKVVKAPAPAGALTDNGIDFSARLESIYQLNDVFLVLEVEPDGGPKQLFPWELGTLHANESVPIALRVPIASSLRDGQFQLHVFAGGAEMMHTEMPADYRDQKLDAMVAKRTSNQPDSLPKPFVVPPLVYPAEMAKAKAEGTAEVAIRITESGRVVDPTVKSASTPAFGEAAVAAVRQWRFLPRMKDGKPVETKATLPIVFSLPKAPVKPGAAPSQL